MSTSTAAVKFSDGTIQWAAFSETGDFLYPWLFDTSLDAYCYGYEIEEPGFMSLENAKKDSEDVEIFVNGLLKYTIRGKASRGHRLVYVDAYIPDMERDTTIPEWFKAIER